jgi:ubiquinone/menaquinone biosynthesis C-methylase UbiE
VSEKPASFEPFAEELAYIRVNERLVDRLVRRLPAKSTIRLLDIAAGTGLMTGLAYERAKKAGSRLLSTLLDIDLPALHQARIDVPKQVTQGFLYASAAALPVRQCYDAVIFANSLHLLDGDAKEHALAESYRALKPGGVIAINSTFFDGAYPEESKPFYSRWIRRSIVEINRRLPQREKGERVQAMEFLPAEAYLQLVKDAGFNIVETRERRVLLSQAAVRAISAYAEFAKGALHASDEDAAEASSVLQSTVQQTFRDLKMKYLPRIWLEIIAVKTAPAAS